MTKRKTTEQFILDSKKIFGDNAFDYSNTVYTTVRDLVVLKCNRCNKEFKKTAHLHLSRKQGCTHCSNNSLTGRINEKKLLKDKELSKKPYRLYYIKFTCSNNNVFYKIGIEDCAKKSRWYSGKNYKVDVLYSEVGKLKDIFNKEQLIIAKHKLGIDKKLWKYGGHTEMLDYNFLSI